MSDLPGVHVLPHTSRIRALFTSIRNKDTNMRDFVVNSNHLLRLLVEYGLSFVPTKEENVTTPTGEVYKGEVATDAVACVSILRAADSMLGEFRAVVPEAPIGKILIQRDESTAQAKLMYHKVPSHIHNGYTVFLLDPMLATGGSACAALRVLTDTIGLRVEKIVFLTLIACNEGLARVKKEFPSVRIVVGEVDPKLDEKKYILPGVGDFGDRYHGTE